jgi:hypothetical protein
MKIYFKIIPTLLILVYGSEGIYASTSVECPEKIRPSTTLTNTPDGWAAMLGGSGDSHFEGVSIYDGHPKEMASLAPDNKGQSTNVYVWTVRPQTNWRICVATLGICDFRFQLQTRSVVANHFVVHAL